MENNFINSIIEKMPDEELCGEVLMWQLSTIDESIKLEDFVRENKASAFQINGSTAERRAEAIEAISKYSHAPAIFSADAECGPIFTSPELRNIMPNMLGCGASNDGELLYESGKYTARFLRSAGVHVTISPCVDVNFNKNNPIVNTRGASDDPERVLRIAGGHGLGVNCENNCIACFKHFPGDGVDDRNQHFCTTINSLSKDEWDATYGKIYSSLIKDGASCIMVGHIALPCYDDTKDELGYLPATLSEKLMKGLLKEQLGFDGCIMSDSLSMLGITSRVPEDKMAVEFLRAGGDFVLFPYKNDLNNIMDALKSGYLPRERLLDAVRRVLRLKVKLGLYEGKTYTPTEEDAEQMKLISKKIAEKSISLIRNYDNVLPIKLSKGARALVLTLTPGEMNMETDPLSLFSNELRERGIEVIQMTNPIFSKFADIIENVDAVFVITNSGINNGGSSTRLGWGQLHSFWRAVIFRNKNLIFISFADPYKLYELPYLKTYINAYSTSTNSIKSAVKACLGEAEFKGKSPVRLEGFFEREE